MQSISPLRLPSQSLEQFLGFIQGLPAVAACEESHHASLAVAMSQPVRLYRFFQLYNYLNAQIASTIASLVGNIGRSRTAFIDSTIPVRDEADYSFALADLVNTASINEYRDPQFTDVDTNEGLSHRLLASGLMKAVGDYAGLNDAQRNSFSIPPWLVGLASEIQTLYSGGVDDLPVLTRAIGAHIASEYSADAIEFSYTWKVLFGGSTDKGFHEHILKHPFITVQGHRFHAHNWLRTHGYYDEKGTVHGAEWVHLQSGFDAAKLLVEKNLSQKAALNALLQAGMEQCCGLLGRFFDRAAEECHLINQPGYTAHSSARASTLLAFLAGTSLLAGSHPAKAQVPPPVIGYTVEQQGDGDGNIIRLIHAPRGDGVCNYRIERIGPDPLRPDKVVVTRLGGASIGCRAGS